MFENLQYQKDPVTEENMCINGTRNGVHISVPLDPNNSDYQAILAWAEEDGNEIQAAE